MDIGQRIRFLRERKKLTLEDVGSQLNVNKATVQRYESGNIDIKRTVAIRLAEVLDTTPAYIMGWTDSPQIPIFSSCPFSKEAEEVAIAYEKADIKSKNIARQALDLPTLETPAPTTQDKVG